MPPKKPSVPAAPAAATTYLRTYQNVDYLVVQEADEAWTWVRGAVRGEGVPSPVFPTREAAEAAAEAAITAHTA